MELNYLYLLPQVPIHFLRSGDGDEVYRIMNDDLQCLQQCQP